MRVKAEIVLLFLLSCACLANRNSGQPYNDLNRREDEYNRVMLFMADPIMNFEKIRDIKNPFLYIGLAEANSEEGVFEPFLKRYFDEADEKRAEILIFLIMLKPRGEIGSLLVDKIGCLFILSPQPFLDVLRKRTDWVDFIEPMKVGDWIDFVVAVRKLSNSGFEGDFKRYVLK